MNTPNFDKVYIKKELLVLFNTFMRYIIIKRHIIPI